MQMHETEPQLTGEAVDSPVMRQNILTAGIELLRTLESQNCEQERNKAFEEREREKKWIIRGGDGKRNLEFRFEEKFAENWSRRSTVERRIWRSNRESRRENERKKGFGRDSIKKAGSGNREGIAVTEEMTRHAYVCMYINLGSIY